MPYKTDVQTTYDSGEFPAVFEKALTLADYAGFKKRKREAARRGKYRGFGISCFLEHSGGVPTEGALLEFPGGEKAGDRARRAIDRPGPCHGLSALWSPRSSGFCRRR